jgi:two-component system response regulator HupR/HoxA
VAAFDGALHGHKPEGFRILLVDDDPALLETTSALLEDEGSVVTAKDGHRALRLFAEREIHVVCADFQMPGMNGIELLRAVHQLDARTIGILMTGFRERLPAGVAGDPAIFALVYKPYTTRSLHETIRDAARCAAMARIVSSFQTRSTGLSGEPKQKPGTK